MSKPKLDRQIKIPDHLFKKLLTPSELRMLKNRYQIINLLDQGLSIRQIAGKLSVGTDTVVRVIRLAEKNTLKKKSEIRKFKTATPWIFGKGHD